MEELESKRIIHNLVFLCENSSNLSELLPKLFENYILSLEEMNTIQMVSY